jgi:hypothetical protein
MLSRLLSAIRASGLGLQPIEKLNAANVQLGTFNFTRASFQRWKTADHNRTLACLHSRWCPRSDSNQHFREET